jgi:phosphatidylglycerol:prolipoprotein diacylglycerol transferase
MSGAIYVHDLDPVLMQLGPLRIGWYGLMYAISFLIFYWVMMRAARRPDALVSAEDVPNLLTYVILGVIVGGRLGWVLFYGGAQYFHEPWRILETWKGGMSFHGGMLGVLVAIWIYCWRRGLSIVALNDYGIIWVPVGLGLGRIGNFINGELYGKPTDGSWGVIFPGDPNRLPRHPSQLYEAFLEGAVLFLLLWVLKRRAPLRGLQPAAFLLGYGLARMGAELIRLPDPQLGYLLFGIGTMGQILSLPMALAGLSWVVWILLRERRKRAAG